MAAHSPTKCKKSQIVFYTSELCGLNVFSPSVRNEQVFLYIYIQGTHRAGPGRAGSYLDRVIDSSPAHTVAHIFDQTI